MQGKLWIWKYVRLHKAGLALTFGLILLKMVSNLSIIGVQKWIVDGVFLGGHYEELTRDLSLFAAAFLLFITLFTLQPYLTEGLYSRIYMEASRDLLKHIYKYPLQTFYKERVAAYVTFFTQDVRRVSEMLTKEIPNDLQLILQVVVLTAIVGWFSFSTLLMVIVLTIAYIVIGRYFGARMQKQAQVVNEHRTHFVVSLEEGLSSTREVVAFHRGRWEKNRLMQRFQSYFASLMQEGRLENKQILVTEPLRWGVNLAVLGYGGSSVLCGEMTIGTFLVLYQYSSQLMEGFQGLFQLMMHWAAKVAFIKRVQGLYSVETVSAEGLSLTEPVAQIAFHDLTFQYEEQERPVLQQLFLEMKRGQKYAFVGPSGGGKSTLIQLLLRQLESSGGEIQVNGSRLQSLNRQAWLGRVAVVLQEPYFFEGTLRDNLLFGQEGISDERVMDASRDTLIDGLIREMPKGLDTWIGERGITLSGGQRQRLALARALLREPEVLILDEATSALDTETERQVQANLDRLMNDRLMVVIAHRLSTIENADRIFVLHKGRLVEQGSHQELFAMKTVYAGLYQQQVKQEHDYVPK